jgi:hypothetical protein
MSEGSELRHRLQVMHQRHGRNVERWPAGETSLAANHAHRAILEHTFSDLNAEIRSATMPPPTPTDRSQSF